MNIEEAKREICRTLRAYRRTTPDGSLRIPVEKQRPLLLIGPPGIGKTAVMKQIAEETGEGLVAYSMTHHTRQSAIGLPVIRTRSYGGREQSVTEYTMSEIVASLYDYIEATGRTRGILFLDEINCVSETLTPVMLQLLQNKTFGTHALPEGWIIVAAGNPPEYNRSVREFDMATLDRVKNMDIEPDLPVWQRYAAARHIHPAIRTYLTVYPDHFYVIREADREQTFVTPRGWEDLSLMLEAWEEEKDPVEEEMIRQYLRDQAAAHSFFSFYRLFRRAGVCWEDTDFRRELTGQKDRLRDLPEVSCLALSAMLFRQLQEEAHGLRLRRRKLLRRREILEEEYIRKEEGLLSETLRSGWVTRSLERIEDRRRAGRFSPEEYVMEKQAVTETEAEIIAWLMTTRDELFRDWEQSRLTLALAREQQEELAFPAAAEEAAAILTACLRGESALRYLRADLDRDPDTRPLLPREC